MNFNKIITLSLCLSFLTACSSRAEREFTQGCEVGGLSSSQCSCIYDNLKDHYPKEVMTQFERQEQIPPNFENVLAHAALQCRDE